MLRWIYPRVCELCGRRCEEELCPECLAKLPRVALPICLYCGATVAGDLADPYHCRECAARPRSFDFARSVLARDDTTLKLVHKIKYHHANYLAPALGGLLSELWEETPALKAAERWVLVPVPAGRAHIYRRGYNQAEELACALGRLRGLPVVNALQRRPTAVDSQTRLSAADRWRNALASYAARGPWAKGRRVLGENVLLVDDVFTTGSTARACARALKLLPGVRRVGVITLLRAAKY